MTIYLPSKGAAAWQELLADPDKQWVKGYSARTLAHCWEAAKGLPPEIMELLGTTAELLIALPEHKVDLPGGRRASQTDLFALIRRNGQTVSCAIEGKVDEAFGPTIEEWTKDASSGKTERLTYLCNLLGLKEPPPPALRYQLLHRTASAIIEADRFKTDEAAMIVHSFSSSGKWFEDFAAFVALFGATATQGQLLTITLPSGRPLHLAWAVGDQIFRSM